ncbi:MAG: hypothetical protein HQL88_10645 [Magnetococcales bacterium]|nr:hypothetical protein [Magnetococcales bacterium]
MSKILTESPMLDWTLQLLNHLWAPWIAVALLALWGGGHWVALQGQFFLPLHRQLLELRRRLETSPEDPVAFAARFADLEEWVERQHPALPTWSAFRNSLHFSASPAPSHTALYGSQPPSHFFNANALMKGQAAYYYYHAVPNVLLGVGVLLTLIGLVAAIHLTIRGMESSDLHVTQIALMGLLNAASVKFLASIAGFAIALLFSWEEKRHKLRLERETVQICQLLLERIAWTADEQLGREQLQASHLQSRQLREIADRLQQVITQPSFQPQGGAVAGDPAHSTEVVERLANRFENSLEQLRGSMNALEETMKARPASAVSEDLLSSVAVTPLLERLVQQWEEERSGRFASQHALLERLTDQMEQAVAALQSRAVAPAAPTPWDLEPLLNRVQQDGERLLQANAAAMEQLLESVGRQWIGMQADATLAELHPDERTHVVEQLAGRMEGLFSSLGDATLSPFQRIASQLEKTMALLAERLPPLGRSLDLQPLLEALQEEGVRTRMAQAELVEAVRGVVAPTGAGERVAVRIDSEERVADLLEQMGMRLEASIADLGSTLEAAVTRSGMEPVLRLLHQEGAQLMRANEVAMQQMLELISQRFTAATATATLSELAPGEREGLLERVALRMEQAVATLGEVGLAPFFEGIRRELGGIPGLDRPNSNEEMQRAFARIAQQLEGITAALESKVWAADHLPDMSHLLRAIRGEGERLIKANEQTLDRLLEELTQRTPAAVGSTGGRDALLEEIAGQMATISQTLLTRSAWAEAGSSAPAIDVEALASRIQREGERLVQANEAAMATLLNEVARRFAGVSATTALAELRPAERSELLDGVAQRMERAVASLGELGLTPFFDGMRHEMGRLIQANQQSVAQLMEEVAQRSREKGRQEAQWLESVAVQVGHAITRMGESFAATLPESAAQFAEGIRHAIQCEGERLQESHQRLLGQLEAVLSQLSQPVATPSPAPMPASEVVAVLDEQSIQPLLAGWRQEGERLVMASEAAFERLLEELGQQFAPLRGSEDVALLEQLSGQLQHSIQVVRSAEAVEAEQAEEVAGDLALGEAAGQSALRPVLREMTRLFSRQRREEQRLLKQVVSEVNRAVAALDAKIGRATPLNMQTLVNTVHQQGERLFASVTTLLPTLTEMTQVIARQRGEEMRLLERVATEVNQAVAALDAKIGRATPLQLQTLVGSVNAQGSRLWEGSQEIVRELQAARILLQSGAAVERGAVVAPVPARRASPSAPEGTAAAVAESQAQGLSGGVPGGLSGVHRLLAELPTSAPAVVSHREEREVVPEVLSLPVVTDAPEGRGALLELYASEPQGKGVAPSATVAWLRAKAAAQAARSAPAPVDSFVRLLANRAPNAQASATPRAAASTPLVKVVRRQGEGAVQSMRHRADGSLHPWVPALVQEFDAKKGRAWQPLTTFIARQTAEFLESQKRFSPFKF